MLGSQVGELCLHRSLRSAAGLGVKFWKVMWGAVAR
jgi:hypothetical protein